MFYKIIVGKDALLWSPKVTVDCIVSELSAFGPACGFVALTEQKRNVLEVAFVAVQEAVETDGGLVMG